MRSYNLFEGGRALRITVGITVLVLVMAGGAGATKFIKDNATGGDCTSFGNWNVATKTCTMTTELNEGIQIDSNGVIMDGNGRTITGDNTGNGVYLSGRSGVIIKNLNIKLFSFGVYLLNSNNNYLMGNNASNNSYTGISLDSSSNNTLIGNNASKNDAGISLGSSSNNTLIGNNASKNDDGIYLWYSSNNTLKNNVMQENNDNFGLYGVEYSNYINQIDTSNLVDGEPIYFLNGAANTIYDSSTNAGTFYCINCFNVTIKDLNLHNNSNGAFFWNTTFSKIQNVKIYNNVQGISLLHSSNNKLSSNNASNNSYGIFLKYSSNNTLNGNTNSNNSEGISLEFSSNNTLSGSNANLNNNNGIYLYNSSNNTLSGNNASNNGKSIYSDYSEDSGIRLSYSSNNTLIGNNASNNAWGISVSYSSNNTLNGNTANSNNRSGIIVDSRFYSHNQIMVRSNNNTLIGNNANSNNYAGISLSSSSNNTLSGNTVNSNIQYGILLSSFSNTLNSSNNLIYNNYFNNTNNAYNDENNTWNITRTSGTNIIGGPYLGGNFWAHPNGTGFSQNCTDANTDGICDVQYTLDSNNIDYLPLSKYTATRVTIISPNGGENWQAGTTKTIKWNYTGSPGSRVKIELLKGTASSIINSNVSIGSSGNGSYSWLISSTQTPGTNYKVRVTSKTSPIYNDTSNNNFMISGGITVTSPNGGEIWPRGTNQVIRWNYSGTPGSRMKIELLKNGTFNRMIDSNAPSGSAGSGSYKWFINSAQKLGTNYEVRVTSRTNPAYTDISNNNFNIRAS